MTKKPMKDLDANEIEAILTDAASGLTDKQLSDKHGVSSSSIKTIKKNFSGKSNAEIDGIARTWHQYRKVLTKLFFSKYPAAGSTDDVYYETKDLLEIINYYNFKCNQFDIKYNTKGRGGIPKEVQETAPSDKEWRIISTGKGKYVFRLFNVGEGVIDIDLDTRRIKIPDAVPSIVEKYARDDEQALLARIRYNNLVSIFLGITAYSLQAHWKTSATRGGAPVEVDEMYVGVDADGVHYAIPVEAKGRERSERLTSDQLLNNYRAAKAVFPNTKIISVAAKVLDEYSFAMLSFQVDPDEGLVNICSEKHYTLALNPSSHGGGRPIMTDDDIAENSMLAAANGDEAEASG